MNTIRNVGRNMYEYFDSNLSQNSWYNSPKPDVRLLNTYPSIGDTSIALPSMCIKYIGTPYRDLIGLGDLTEHALVYEAHIFGDLENVAMDLTSFIVDLLVDKSIEYLDYGQATPSSLGRLIFDDVVDEKVEYSDIQRVFKELKHHFTIECTAKILK